MWEDWVAIHIWLAWYWPFHKCVWSAIANLKFKCISSMRSPFNPHLSRCQFNPMWLWLGYSIRIKVVCYFTAITFTARNTKRENRKFMANSCYRNKYFHFSILFSLIFFFFCSLLYWLIVYSDWVLVGLYLR